MSTLVKSLCAVPHYIISFILHSTVFDIISCVVVLFKIIVDI